MKLRQQLLILSLIILSLPWAGCQYVREMERVMLEGQERELLASARAVALRLSEEPGLFEGADEKTSGASIYFHNLPSVPDIDGYMDEWRAWNLSPVEMLPDISKETFKETSSSAKVQSGFIDDHLYMHIDIQDDSPSFSDPGLGLLETGDYLEVVFTNERGDEQKLFVFAGSPGPVIGRSLDTQEQPVEQNKTSILKPDYRLTGYWVNNASDNQKGHQIELRIDPALLNRQLAIRYIDQSVSFRRPISQLKHGFDGNQIAFYAIANPELERDIALFANDDLRFGLSDRTGWLLGSAGSLSINESPEANGQHGLIVWIYSHILRTNNYPELDDWKSEGRFRTLDVMATLLGQTRTAIYSSTKNGPRIVRAVFPVQRGGEMLGAVIAEKSSAAVISATDGAFSRLIFWVILVTLFISIGMLVYASVLSLRIRRLSMAAASAMEDPASGQLAEHFTVSKLSDEIGDLSRNYHELLGRLDEYTLYLKTLSSKLSHELRTPLAVIRSSLDNLQHQEVSEDAGQYLERAIDGVTRLSAILTAMSSASRLEESIKNSEFETADMGELLCSVVAGYQSAYPDNEFAIEMRKDAYETKVSPDLIVQMLDKLVDNALDFSPEDKPIIIGLHVLKDEWLLSVRNSGPLLPDNMKSQLFDSLVSVRTEKTGDPHLGLGLHIVKLIADYHDAKVSADNLPDQSGVQFQIVFCR